MPSYLNRAKFSKVVEPQPDAIGSVITEALQEFIVVGAMGLWGLLKSFFTKKAVVTIPLVFALAVASFVTAKAGWHIRWIHDMDPIVFTYARLKWLTRVPILLHALFLFGLY